MAITHKKSLMTVLGAFATAAMLAAIACITSGCDLADASSVKRCTNDYSWSELSSISEQIAAAEDQDAALEIAKKFNLTTPEGTLDGTQEKTITLADGTETAVQIAGFAHDDKADGSGKAGITFIFKNAIAEHNMNTRHTNAGGWKESNMRSWLQSEAMDMLPMDLRDKIVDVEKLSNNRGETKSTSSISSSTDSLWLYSLKELVGDVEDTNPDFDYSYLIDLFNAAGEQYQLFIDTGAHIVAPDEILVKTYHGYSYYWWTRSPDSFSTEYFAYIDPDGRGYYGNRASFSFGVVPGFCI